MSVKPLAVILWPARRLSSIPVSGLLPAWLILNGNMLIAYCHIISVRRSFRAISALFWNNSRDAVLKAAKLYLKIQLPSLSFPLLLSEFPQPLKI